MIQESISTSNKEPCVSSTSPRTRLKRRANDLNENDTVKKVKKDIKKQKMKKEYKVQDIISNSVSRLKGDARK